MKWISLLWSIVTLTALTLLVALITRRSTGIIAGWFPFALISWIILTITSPFILLARLFGMIASPTTYFYILTGVANLAFGVIGWISLAKGMSENSLFLDLSFALNILLAAFILFDSFVRPISVSKKIDKQTSQTD
jgi:uncharacterized membrane protein YuzA (DUF378 family)